MVMNGKPEKNFLYKLFFSNQKSKSHKIKFKKRKSKNKNRKIKIKHTIKKRGTRTVSNFKANITIVISFTRLQLWNALSDEQKQRVRDLRFYVRQANNQQNQNNNNGSNGQQRQIQQMNRNDDTSLPSQIQLPPAPSQIQPNNPKDNIDSVQSQSGRAGDAFSGQRSGIP